MNEEGRRDGMMGNEGKMGDGEREVTRKEDGRIAGKEERKRDKEKERETGRGERF